MSTSSFSQTLRAIRWIAAAMVLVIAVSFAIQMTRQPPPARTEVNIGGPFTLTDTSGKIVTQADFLGKPMLVYFGYSYCPDVCPYALQMMASALDTLGKDKSRITPVFITVDPERDTPENLAQYVHSASFPDGLVGLTGTPEQIKAIAKAYAVYFKKVGEGDDYVMDHTSAMFLMDKDGKYVAVFTHSSSVDDIAKCLRRHLDGKRC
ncbi:MAG: SCO family protein [Robiginitomaculum sp.]|nr:SCO family protein [Robiginitomaculum sp.]MDQ7076295.1 SCO family protein [Robiginitomaculum sp.]